MVGLEVSQAHANSPTDISSLPNILMIRILNGWPIAFSDSDDFCKSVMLIFFMLNPLAIYQQFSDKTAYYKSNSPLPQPSSIQLSLRNLGKTAVFCNFTDNCYPDTSTKFDLSDSLRKSTIEPSFTDYC